MGLKEYYLGFVVLLSNAYLSVHAQETALLGVSKMQKYEYDDDSIKGIDIRALGYFRNTEFFHPMEQGRSQFGLQLNAFWKSSIKDNRRLEFGTAFNQQFGGGIKLYPHIALVQFLGHQFIFGEIRFGSLSNPGHGLPEPIYNPAIPYINPVEYGIQYISPKTDLWMNWDQAIVFASPFKETFVLGINQSLLHFKKMDPLNRRLNKARGNFYIASNFDARLYALYRHVGGQIDVDEATSTGNRGHMAFQASVCPTIFIKSGAQHISLKLPRYSYSFLHYYDPKSSFSEIAFGSGHLHSVSKKWKDWQLNIKSWIGKNWMAPFGQGIYQSYNPEDISVEKRERSRFLIISSSFTGSSFGLNGFSLGYDGYYDKDLQNWNTAFTFNFLMKI
jgi:hypothetical protein